MTFQSVIVKTATAEIGVEEIDGTNCGPRVNEYKAATTLPPDQEWPWCAAFVCWIIRESLKAAGIPETPSFHRPTTASAWGLESWSLKQDQTTWTRKLPRRDIMPGDIIVFSFSHCGIAISECDETGHFQTIEGNTDGQGTREGGAVLSKWRRSSQVRSRIRFRL